MIFVLNVIKRTSATFANKDKGKEMLNMNKCDIVKILAVAEETLALEVKYYHSRPSDAVRSRPSLLWYSRRDLTLVGKLAQNGTYVAQ
jgi:hypothetical protein